MPRRAPSPVRHPQRCLDTLITGGTNFDTLFWLGAAQ